MRSTFRIDDDVLAELKARARRENLSLTRLVNRVLRDGARAARSGAAKRRRHRETVHSMGAPRVDLRKAMSLAAALEDQEAARKLTLRK